MTIKLYPLFHVLRAGYFWTPIFYFFLEDKVGAKNALFLEAVYFLLVVVLEVPSGYLADRVGRKATLLISQLFGAIGGGLFFFAGHTEDALWLLLVAQAFFALWHACFSGTTAALLYDALLEEGREVEFVVRESKSQFYSRLTIGGACLAGGFIATKDLALPYALMAASSVLGFVVLLFMKEPKRVFAGAVISQLKNSVGALKDKTLLWVILFGVALLVFAHIPYEVFQPYLALAFEDSSATEGVPPAVVAGVLMGINSFAAGLGARLSVPLARVVGGEVPALILSFLLLTLLIISLGAFLHPVVGCLLALRSVTPGIANPLQMALAQPRVTSDIRSTLWSLRSLVGRLLFAGVAAGMGLALGDGEATWARLQPVLIVSAAAAAIVTALLFFFRPRAQTSSPAAASE